MAQYYRVSPNFWKGRHGWSDREKLLAQYLLSSPHRNLEGLFWLPLAYVQADLGWPAKAVDEALATLERDEFALYDADAQVIFLCRALKYQAPSSPKQVAGAVSSLERVPKTELWARFLNACSTWAPRLADDLGDALATDRNGIRIGLETHANDTGEPSESDPDIAGARCSSSSSSSLTQNYPPLTPPPRAGGRVRNISARKEEMESWAQREFPDLPVTAVVGYAESAVREGHSTPEDIRDYVLRNCGAAA